MSKKVIKHSDLAESERSFRLLIQGVADYAIFMLDPDGYVRTWNAGAERIKGYPPEDIIGKHYAEFYTPEDRRKGTPQKVLETARREGRFSMTEAIRLRKDGTTFVADILLDAIHDDDGKLIGFAKITRDVTERVATRQELERAKQALFQSQKLEAIGQLTGGIAHDFNNLLAAITTSLQLVLRQQAPALTPRSRQLIENASSAARRGRDLTRRMLVFARQHELKLAAVDLHQLVSEMSDLMQVSVGSGIRVQTTVPPGLPRVWADLHQLELALLNLVVNARDAMPNGGTVRVEAETAVAKKLHADEGEFVKLSVIDSGCGMDSDTLERAMLPFFTTKPPGEGTGLGLSTVHGLAEQLGGWVELKSEVGTGTSASIVLPIYKTNHHDTVALATPASEERSLPSVCTVLVVDDDALVLTSMVGMIEELGHKPLGANGIKAALDLVERLENIDIVVLDQTMPVMRGTDLAKILREKYPGLPVIIASGFADPKDAPGENYVFLSKPFELDELHSAMKGAFFSQRS